MLQNREAQKLCRYESNGRFQQRPAGNDSLRGIEIRTTFDAGHPPFLPLADVTPGENLASAECNCDLYSQQ